MNRVRLSQEEAQWFGRNILKSIELCISKAKKDPLILERKTFKGLKSMEEKAKLAKETATEQLDLILSSKQKIIVREIAGSLLLGLRNKIIPNYEQRGADLDPKYLINAKAKADMLQGLYRKLS